MKFLFVLFLFLVGCAPQSQDAQTHAIVGPPPPYYAWIGVTGKSMRPTFPESFWAQVDFTFPYENLKVGDLVVFWDYAGTGGYKFTFHRIVEQKDGYFVTRGDNKDTNPVPDASRLTVVNYLGKGTGKYTLVLLMPNIPTP